VYIGLESKLNMQPKDLQLLIRLSKKDRQILEKLAEAWGTSLAGAIRQAIRIPLNNKDQR
jgi:hypothetical protein